MRKMREREAHVQNQNFSRQIKRFSLVIFAAALVTLAGCGDGGTAPGTGNVAATTAASLQLSATSTSVPSDNSASTTITVTALDGSNAALSGIVVTLSTDTGIVSSPTVTTGTDGTVSFTFRSGTSSLANRTATITATAGASAQIPIQISGSTLSVFTFTGASVPNDGTSPITVTFIAKNAVGTGLPGVAYTASWVTGTGGQVTISPTSGVTDAQGKFVITVTGAAANGTATVSATAAGSTASQTVTVSAAAGTFGITQTLNSTGSVATANPTSVPMQLGDSLTVTVSAPAPSTNVRFTTSMGTWGSGTTTQTVAVAGGVASAVLQQTSAGVASVQVDDPLNTSLVDTLTVGVTALTAASITVTATPSVVSKSSGSTSGASTLIAKVLDGTGQPVGNAPVAFSMSNTTGGGESISPVVAYTAAIAGGGLALGEARATFTSGSLSSATNGVQIRASVLGTSVVTEANLPTPLNATASGNDASVVIGGTAGSIAFGIATEVIVPNSTTYQLPMSVLVADSNGNAVANAVVNLSAWPYAWSTGTVALCAYDADTATAGTFLNEDVNGNLILDSGEDGIRTHLPGSGVVATSPGTLDGALTPINSAAGSLPASVTTDANGVANFNLTYLKTSAIYTVDRIRATTVVQGSASVSQIIFRLPAAVNDVGTTSTTCKLAGSPYNY
jgi:hypothetical protein